MFKKILSILFCVLLTLSLCACAGSSSSDAKEEKAQEASSSAQASEEKEASAASAQASETAKASSASAQASESAETSSSSAQSSESAEASSASSQSSESGEAETPESLSDIPLNLYVLAGPTGIGAMNLWSASDAGETAQKYNITMTGANDEIVAAISKGDADIAAIATNLASVLYNKTGGGISVLAVNTLGVLSILSSGEQLESISDLAGRTIYSPGQGANPEYILRYVLKGNGLDPDNDVDIRFVGEGSELLTIWETEPEAFIMAPQPVATSLLMQNEGAVKLFDMTDEWAAVSGGESSLMMGCVVVRNEYLKDHAAQVEAFLKEYGDSIRKAIDDPQTTSVLCENYGLIPKAALAKKAIPQCGLAFVTGEEMKESLSGYLQVMYDSDPGSIGGAMPGEDFYY
ncbi:MAG: ABC transporter substrate-binding protein [Parasporobacterium sp.]|nr:ABC transporter substrate-binding protein [Parasporobacterium sp.]